MTMQSTSGVDIFEHPVGKSRTLPSVVILSVSIHLAIYTRKVSFLAQLTGLSYYKLVKMLPVRLDVCLAVNRGETNHNCCTQRLVIVHAQTY